MTVIGFGFTKMLVEKLKPIKGKLSINNNVGLKGVEETDLKINNGKKALKFNFEFTSRYEPDFAKLDLEGEVIFLVDEDKAKSILASWKKNKSIDKDLMAQILNNVLSKCNIEALILTKEINLPPPIPLPTVGMKNKAS